MIKPTKFKSKLLSKKYISDNTFELVYSVPEDFEFVAGQFANIAVTLPYKRPYSILFQKENTIGFMVGIREPGIGADYFRDIEVGSETEIFGPLGKFSVKETLVPKVFISTGVGFVPFLSMIGEAVDATPPSLRATSPTLGEEQSIKLYQGFRFAKDDYVYPYIEEFIKEGKLKYIKCLSREMLENPVSIDQDGKENNVQVISGRVTNVIETQDLDWKNTEFYVCGSNEMIKEVRAILLAKGAVNVFVENYG